VAVNNIEERVGHLDAQLFSEVKIGGEIHTIKARISPGIVRGG
jgi:hypothetical protein